MTSHENTPSLSSPAPILQVQGVSIYYSGRPALLYVSLDIYPQQLTTFIGPSGCGKSSLLACFNAIHKLVPQSQIRGSLKFKGVPLATISDLVLRRQIGMVFQRPNPFPKSIYNNIALGLRVNGYRGDIDERVEQSLRQVSLWNDVKDRLRQNAMDLSSGQQQRLCIARAIALGSEVLLMDEPCAYLDPISTSNINTLLNELKQHYTVVVVTHNLKQAAAISDRVAFFNLVPYQGQQVGKLVEYGYVPDIFVQPQHCDTLEYIYYQSFTPPFSSATQQQI